MAMDSLVANPGRLKILTSLAGEGSQEFVRLRQRTNLTDGNLSTHARRLASAGLLEIDKTFRAGKPVTTITLTRQGRAALESHVQGIMAALNLKPLSPQMQTEDEWVD
jgi:DNA-binding MarR family transcriptional regulator